MSLHKKSASNRNDKQGGLSLVELLVSILLGIFLTAGIVAVYLESKRNYAADEEIARIQENGRFALGFLKRELSLAGFFGGSLRPETITVLAVTGECADSGNWVLDISTSLDLIDDYTPGDALDTVRGVTFKDPACIEGDDLQDGADVLSIKRTAGEASWIDGVPAPNFTRPSANDQWYLRLLDYGIEKEWVKRPSADLQDPNSGAYDPNDINRALAYWEAFARIFYIRDHSSDPLDGIPTLCMKTLESDAMVERCLVEGIEDMQIEFGIDDGVDLVPDRYESDPTVAELSNAVSARLYLLLRSIDDLPGYSNSKSYTLGQKAVPAKNDGYIRRVFSTTVLMRNAVLPAR